jgi:CO/xanthine dehydrogenase FAD-binding subunit
MKSNQPSDTWSIDADAALQAVLDSFACPPLFHRTLSGVLSWQTRNETSVSRVLASPRVAPQWVAALLALGATVTVEGAAEEVPLAEAKSGSVQALHVRVERLCWGEARVARTPADEPIVAAMAAVRMEDGVVQEARVALTGVWPEPVRLAESPAQLVGGPLDREGIQAVAQAVEQEVAPAGDFLGSELYRRAMAGVLTRRVLAQCLRERDDE